MSPELALKDGPPQAGLWPAPEVKATKAKGGADVKLSGMADSACLAGGGRYLLLRLPARKRVAVFDTLEGKVVKELPLHEDGALVAGSRTYAFVVYPKAGVVQRWRLEGFEHEATTRLPDGFAPTAAVMGHSGEGPLLLGGRTADPAVANPSGFYDPLTLKRLELKGEDRAKPLFQQPMWVHKQLSASPDGRTFAWAGPPPMPAGIHSITLDGNTLTVTKSDGYGGVVRVGADGHLFTATGVFTGDHATVLDAHSPKVTAGAKGVVTPPHSRVPGRPLEGLGRGAVPAADGPFYLWFPELKSDNGKLNLDTTPALKAVGVKEPLAQLDSARGTGDADPWAAVVAADGSVVHPTGVPIPHRAFLVPSAGLMAVLSPDGTNLHLHSVKCRDLLDKSGTDYLFVTGRPQQHLARNQMWLYTPEVWSKKGGLKIELVNGPDRMKVVNGAVVWAVPEKWAEARTRVELKISDASGKSVSHAFDLLCPEATPAPAATPK
jgi:hypothetical protein